MITDNSTGVIKLSSAQQTAHLSDDGNEVTLLRERAGRVTKLERALARILQ